MVCKNSRSQKHLCYDLPVFLECFFILVHQKILPYCSHCLSCFGVLWKPFFHFFYSKTNGAACNQDDLSSFFYRLRKFSCKAHNYCLVYLVILHKGVGSDFHHDSFEFYFPNSALRFRAAVTVSSIIFLNSLLSSIFLPATVVPLGE